MTDRYTDIVPTKAQKALQDMGFYMFIHFGMNTMFGSEGCDGTEPATAFDPQKLDTDKWAKVAKDAGAGAIIFTAKHQEGFCLWPTNTTKYSIKNSPFMNGEGDIVRSLADSCKKYGIKLGFYLSPADRNCADYGTDKYNDFYCEQLTELLTNYGDVFCLWFDVVEAGALNEINGKRQDFDYERVFSLARGLQPDIILANGGPDVRWVGNEASITRKSEWCVVPACVCPAYAKKYDGEVPAPKPTDEDLGSRELLKKYDEYLWYPAEVDYSLHKGWFYHPFEMPRSLARLYSAYMRSVGGNCTFLLNVPPNKQGEIVGRDVRRLKQLKKKIDRTFANVISADFTGDGELVYRNDSNGHKVKTIILREDVDYSQRVEEFSLTFLKDGRSVKEYKGTTIGFCKYVCLDRAVKCDSVVLSILKYRGESVYIKSFEIYG